MMKTFRLRCRGDRTGLIGPDGIGKTTLREILAGNYALDTRTRALRKQTRLAYILKC
jgi:ATPase subunit of ABC transporter with duplicated ATPase domains